MRLLLSMDKTYDELICAKRLRKWASDNQQQSPRINSMIRVLTDLDKRCTICRTRDDMLCGGNRTCFDEEASEEAGVARLAVARCPKAVKQADARILKARLREALQQPATIASALARAVPEQLTLIDDRIRFGGIEWPLLALGSTRKIKAVEDAVVGYVVGGKRAIILHGLQLRIIHRYVSEEGRIWKSDLLDYCTNVGWLVIREFEALFAKATVGEEADPNSTAGILLQAVKYRADTKQATTLLMSSDSLPTGEGLEKIVLEEVCEWPLLKNLAQ